MAGHKDNVKLLQEFSIVKMCFDSVVSGCLISIGCVLAFNSSLKFQFSPFKIL